MKDCWLTRIPIAHRGLHQGEIYENTLPAFEEAAKHGFPIETDLRMTKDGNLVILHDPTPSRMCGEIYRTPVSDLTLDEVKTLYIRGTYTQIPTLEELLNTINGSVGLLLEIKPFKNIEQLAQKLDETLKSYKGEYAVQSFNPSFVKWYRKNSPDTLRGQLVSDYRMIAVTEYKNSHFVSMNLERTAEKIETEIKQRDISLLYWTVDSPQDKAFAENRADNYIFENLIPEI